MLQHFEQFLLISYHGYQRPKCKEIEQDGEGSENVEIRGKYDFKNRISQKLVKEFDIIGSKIVC